MSHKSFSKKSLSQKNPIHPFVGYILVDMTDENEINMEFTPPTNDQDLSETNENSISGIRPVSPSGVNVSEEFLYDNMELIAELHTFQAQLEHLHNCMQAVASSKQDAKLTAQTNELVLKVEELINNLGIPLGKIPAILAEAEKIKLSVEERRNPKP
ncbi:hypothetical protein CEXT_784991 [Caerostris extrusa]|uniref:Biogenesis of lysosome-related organelles complex 1 subunit 3 n=1 Tax=Caerostris extrusa TaxID=172846 RepID=A0AAV4SDE6_CAEEX|nr:hypothetical protein CEXT_784991 [Caerostris extrusa]